MTEADRLVAEVRRCLSSAGDPERAARQRAYMKSSLRYQGLASPELQKLMRPVLTTRRIESRAEWERAARLLWDGAEVREHRYAALALLRHRHYRDRIDPDLLPLLHHLVVSGAWWDLVDEIATHLVGDVLAGHHTAARPVLRTWARDEDLWLRRTAILAQIRHRGATDTALLAEVLDANLDGSPHGSDFFIRKAVGWALRQHARTDPAWVQSYVDTRADRLSGLSRREALRHLG